MKKLFILSLFISASCLAQYNQAVFSVINKKKGQTKELTVQIGNENSFEDLNIKLNSCKLKKSSYPNDFWAHVNIKNQKILFEDEGANTKNYNLWLSSISPSLSGITDDTYDITLVKCE